MKKLKVVFCGTPDFSVPTLELLSEHPAIDLVGVVTMPDRPAGRGQQLKAPPVAEFASLKKIPLFQTENINKEPQILEHLEKCGVDFFVVLAFAQFLGSKVLALPRLGCFNIHTSILPKYRGAAPIQYALLNGDKETGVTIQKMVKKMDAGDVVIFDHLKIGDHETGGQLYTRLKFQAALSCNRLIEDLLANKLVATAQDEAMVSFAPTLNKEDGLLRFAEKDYAALYNQVRALKPWPGTYCLLENQRLKVIDVESAPESFKEKLGPGEVSADKGMLIIGTHSKPMRLSLVQLEGKKACSDGELLNGMKNKFDLGKLKLTT